MFDRRPDPELQKRLDACILDPHDYIGSEGRSGLSDTRPAGGVESPMITAGRPRRASRRHAFNRLRVYGEKSYFDSANQSLSDEEK